MGIRVPGLVVVALSALSVSAFAGDEAVLVGFKTGADVKVVEKHGGKADAVLGKIKVVAARVPASKIADLRSDPDVAYVEEDGIVENCDDAGSNGKGGGAKPAPSQPAQTTPWGITRVGAPVSGNAGTGIKVAVIDTGIDLDHPDLAANVQSGATFVGSSAEDDNGHGTHVAGTIGALDNSIGVVGVAPEVSLYPVKVLDRRGSGTWSAVAGGITWAGDNGMAVANMSLGGSSSSSALEAACTYAEGQGVLLVAASGNSGDGNTSTTELSYPAAYSSVVAVGATSSTDSLASFSNTGSFVELSGPGVSVNSTYKGDVYKTLNGTSMASPHAAGVAALLWKGLTAPTLSDVRTALQNRAEDRGATGRDSGYGFGIVHY